eukprot:1970867-Prymnesium_polylepis.1
MGASHVWRHLRHLERWHARGEAEREGPVEHDDAAQKKKREARPSRLREPAADEWHQCAGGQPKHRGTHRLAALLVAVAAGDERQAA